LKTSKSSSPSMDLRSALSKLVGFWAIFFEKKSKNTTVLTGPVLAIGLHYLLTMAYSCS
jgi:hypothetical protein